MSARQSFRDWMAGSTVAHVGFAFIAMGGWAVFANRDHALGAMLLAGLVQGTISAVLTLCLKKFLEWLAARMSPTLRQAQRDVGGDAAVEGRRQPELVEGGAGRLAALIVPPFITATTILFILLIAHALAGTPEIVPTVAMPFSVSTTYAILYNLRLWRARFA